MSKIWINDLDIPIEGTFSFDMEYDDRQKPPIYSITGVLETADGYHNDIRSIQNHRYKLNGVKVFRESYGSEDDTILYYFTAESYGGANLQ